MTIAELLWLLVQSVAHPTTQTTAIALHVHFLRAIMFEFESRIQFVLERSGKG
jgi:hypothetical protein